MEEKIRVIKEYLSDYSYILFFILFSFLLEKWAVYMVHDSFEIARIFPFSFLMIVFGFFAGFFGGKGSKIFLGGVFLFQFLMHFGFIILFEMQGGKIFEPNMLTLIGEAIGATNGSLSLNWGYIVGAFVIGGIFLGTLILSPAAPSYYITGTRKSTILSLIKGSTFLILILLMFSFFNIITNDSPYEYQEDFLSNEQSYNEKGMFPVLFESFSFLSVNPNQIDSNETSDYLFGEVQEGTFSKGDDNLILIMVETFEWYSFLTDTDEFPNGLDLTNDELDLLFPNLRDFYRESVKGTNYSSFESTIVAENHSILGNAPYRMPANSLSYETSALDFSLPNVWKDNYPDSVVSYWHNNSLEYYDRDVHLDAYGFDNIYGAERIDELSDAIEYAKYTMFTDIENGITDHSLISELANEMFPINQQFFTYWTTLTMHGAFDYSRENLSEEYNHIDTIIPNYNWIRNEEDLNLRNYLAGVVNFDWALGELIQHLKENDIYDDTTIIMFGDHSAYSNYLREFVRNTDDPREVHKVPFLIKDNDLMSQEIRKFSSPMDIPATVFDLFGFEYYPNIYLGKSFFSEESSPAFSYHYRKYYYDALVFGHLQDDTLSEMDFYSRREHVIEIYQNYLNQQKYIDQWFHYQGDIERP